MGGNIGETDNTEAIVMLSQNQTTCMPAFPVCDLRLEIGALLVASPSLRFGAGAGYAVPLRREKNAGKLPTSAPAEEDSIPITAAMMNSNGHRLCEVGSFAVSTAIRASIRAGTAAPTPRITAMRRALPTARAAAARTPTTTKPIPYKVVGSETFA